ncbi:MAG TPA: DUF4398 domain-containing protein [Gammaproteobacteria bacterium]|nr:DUF4398 domain-containing protein [Gammaproteobacteria bacterium]
MDIFGKLPASAALMLIVAACASAPPPALPTSALADAQTAITQAEQANADRYAPVALDNARDKLDAAERALGPDRDNEDQYNDARRLAEEAAADAQFARAQALAKQAELHASAAAQRASDTPPPTPQPLTPPPGGAS